MKFVTDLLSVGTFVMISPSLSVLPLSSWKHTNTWPFNHMELNLKTSLNFYIFMHIDTKFNCVLVVATWILTEITWVQSPFSSMIIFCCMQNITYIILHVKWWAKCVYKKLQFSMYLSESHIVNVEAAISHVSLPVFFKFPTQVVFHNFSQICISLCSYTFPSSYASSTE